MSLTFLNRILLCLSLTLGLVTAAMAQESAVQVESLSMKDAAWQRTTEGFVSENDGIRAREGQKASLSSKPFEVQIGQGAPFLSYHVVWHGTNLDASRIQHAYSTSTDGIAWSDWAIAPFDGHDNQTEIRLVSHQQYLPADTKYIRFRLELSGAAVLEQAELHLFNPGKSTGKKEQQQESAQRVQADCPKPAVVSREEWNALERSESGISTSEVTHLIVHHEAGSNESSDWAARVRAIQYFHINGNGWYDIGYNFLVDPNGIVYEGRVGGDDAIGAHYCARNRNTMGVCMLGDYSVIEPTILARQGLHKILAWKAAKESIDPLTSSYHYSVGDLPHIAGHRDGGCTFCPGDGMYGLLGNVRNAVDSLINNGCPGVGAPIDSIPPVTQLSLPAGDRYTDDLVALMTDSDAGGIEAAYYLAEERIGNHWSANEQNGFLSAAFATFPPEGMVGAGDWQLLGGTLEMGQAGPATVHIPLQQSTTANLTKIRLRLSAVNSGADFSIYLRGTSLLQTELGTAYKVSLQPAASRISLYRITGNQPEEKATGTQEIATERWLELWMSNDPASGQIKLWLDGEQILTWQDPVPLSNGAYLSLKVSGLQAAVDQLSQYKERPSGEILISVGPEEDQDMRQPSLANEVAGRIRTQSIDQAGNWSEEVEVTVYLDFNTLVVTAFGLYPNPQTTGEGLTLLVPEQPRAVIGLQLLSVSGQELAKKELRLNDGQYAYDLSTLVQPLDNGLYLLRIGTGADTKQLRLLINR